MRRKNNAKERFLSRFPNTLIENHVDRLLNYISFSFQYFDISQEPSSSFSDMTKEQLVKFLEKLKNYTCNTLKYWIRQPIGSHRQNVLEIYKDFPRKSEFTHPKNVPVDVWWARFRLEGDMRLIGFLLPDEIATEKKLNKNVFYIVFIDEKHKFYLTN
jgi:hypothetical protein